MTLLGCPYISAIFWEHLYLFFPWSNTSVQYFGKPCIYFRTFQRSYVHWFRKLSFCHFVIGWDHVPPPPTLPRIKAIYVFSFAHLAGLMFIGHFPGQTNVLCLYLQTPCVISTKSQCKQTNTAIEPTCAL